MKHKFDGIYAFEALRGIAGDAAADVMEGRLPGNSLDALPVTRSIRARVEPPGAA